MENRDVASQREAQSIMKATRKWYGRVPLRWLKVYLASAVRSRGKFPKPDVSWKSFIARIKARDMDALRQYPNAAPASDMGPDAYSVIMLDFGWRPHKLTSVVKDKKLVAKTDLPLDGSPLVVALTLTGLISHAETTVGVERLAQEAYDNNRVQHRRRRLSRSSSSEAESGEEEEEEEAPADSDQEGATGSSASDSDDDDAAQQSPRLVENRSMGDAFREASAALRQIDRLVHTVRNLARGINNDGRDAGIVAAQVNAALTDLDAAVEASQTRMQRLAANIDEASENDAIVRIHHVIQDVARVVAGEEPAETTALTSFGRPAAADGPDADSDAEDRDDLSDMTAALTSMANIARICGAMESFGNPKGSGGRSRGASGGGGGRRSTSRGGGVRFRTAGGGGGVGGMSSGGRRSASIRSGGFSKGGGGFRGSPSAIRAAAPVRNALAGLARPRFLRSEIARQRSGRASIQGLATHANLRPSRFFQWRTGIYNSRVLYPVGRIAPIPFSSWSVGIRPNINLWLGYPWFSLWFYQYYYDIEPFGLRRDPYYRAMREEDYGVLGFPALGSIDPQWSPLEINEHIVYLEDMYFKTVQLGLRIVLDPLSNTLLWVKSAHIPRPGDALPPAWIEQY